MRASIRATAENTLVSQLVKRDRAVSGRMISSIVERFESSESFSTRWSSFLTIDVMVVGSPEVRINTEMARGGVGGYGKYRSGSAVGLFGRFLVLVSRTTPTILSHGEVDAAPPVRTRLPTGSCPGQN